MTHAANVTLFTAMPAGALGIESALVHVSISRFPHAVPMFVITGVPAVSSKEISVRVRSALSAIGREMPSGSVSVNVSGVSDVPRPSSAGFDLAIVLGLLGPAFVGGATAGATIDTTGLVVVGELGLDGSVRAVRGVLAATELATASGLGVLVPAANAAEALAVEGARVHAIDHLTELAHGIPAARSPASEAIVPALVDMAEVRGPAVAAVAAIADAVAAGRDVVLTGAPGTGKTMLARRVTTILPAMTRAERIAVTKTFSALGLASGLGLFAHRSFRAPHHTISAAAIGGGSGRPGEAHLAAHGVLLLDELVEFPRATLEALRGALEAMGSARPMVIAAVNACPCGWNGSAVRECSCTESTLRRHNERLTKALALLHLTEAATIAVEPTPLADLRGLPAAESSREIRARLYGSAS